jgi:succinate-semialdehyde dehydrogenase/glutarate-semialdehyde dehydrogenase
MMTIQAINPATSEVVKTYEEMAPATVKDIVSKTHEAFLGWRRTTFSDRAGLMRKAAEILRANAGEYARVMAQEMGKPVRDGVGEAQKCALGCDSTRSIPNAFSRASRLPSKHARASSPLTRWESYSP